MSGQPGLSFKRLYESVESGTSCFPNGSRRGSTVEVRRAKLSDLGDGGGSRRDPGTIYKESSLGSQAGAVRASSVFEGHGGEARGPDGRSRTIGNRENRENRENSGRAGDEKQTWNVTRATKKDTSRGSARPTLLKDIRETDSRRRHNRRGTPEGCGDGVRHGGERTIPPRADRGERGQRPGRYGIRGVNSGCADLEEVGSCGR